MSLLLEMDEGPGGLLVTWQGGSGHENVAGGAGAGIDAHCPCGGGGDKASHVCPAFHIGKPTAPSIPVR